MSSFLLERDLLYSTENILDPGCFHVKILNPEVNTMPVVIEPKSSHSILSNSKTILDVLQKEIFDRIHIKISESVTIYIFLNDADKSEFQGVRFVKIIFDEDKGHSFVPVDEDEFLLK